MTQLSESIFGGAQFLAFKQRPTGREVQIQWGLQSKSPGAAGDGVGSVKQRHRRDQDAAIGATIGMNHCRNIVRAFQFNLQTRRKRLAHERDVAPIGRVNVLKQQFPIIDGGSEHHHTGSENVCGAELK